MKQLIFVVESDSSSKIDDRYIKKLIHEMYIISNNEYQIQFIHLNGKGNYKSKKIVSQIEKYIILNKEGNNYVFYCIDTDEINTKRDEFDFFKKIENFCQLNQYYLIWFYRNIEHAILNRNICDNLKKKEASLFYRNSIDIIDIQKRLSCISLTTGKKGKSNFCCVLDEIIERKN